MSNNPYHQSTASVPHEPPPAYSHAPQDASGHLLPTLAASSSTPGAPPLSHRRSSSGASSHTYSSFEDEDESGIPTDERRSMDDAMRPLPEGWRREFDPATEHFFYVDVTANPPRSIWTHPYDPEYLSSNPSDKSHSRVYAPPPGPPPSQSQSHPHSHSSPTSPTPDKKPTPTTGAGAGHPKDKDKDKDKDDRTFGRKMKDKLTGTTHEQRVEQRRRQAELERKQYEAYLARRQQLLEAQRNGTYAPMYAAPSGPFGRPAYGYGNGYGRGYGGYGGGMGGMGTGMALGGGLLGGLLIGDLLF